MPKWWTVWINNCRTVSSRTTGSTQGGHWRGSFENLFGGRGGIPYVQLY